MPCVNPLCQREVAAGARFCPFCRTEQPSEQMPPPVDPPAASEPSLIVCSQCYNDNPAYASACGRCGAKLLKSPPPEFLQNEFVPKELRQKEFLAEERVPPVSVPETERPFAQTIPQGSSALVAGQKACAYCPQKSPATALTCSNCGTPFPFPGATRPGLSPVNGLEVLTMRPGDSIWHTEEEEEEETASGQRRPLLILDEQVVHLAHTDRRLDPAVLQARVQQLLAAQQAPVDVALVETRWLRDPGETRPRLVAWLRNHRFSDIKLLLGVDYMGSWASIQMHLGIEPEARQRHHIPRKDYFPPNDAIIAIVLGVIGLVIFIGIFAIAYGIWRIYTTYKAHQRDQAAYIVQQREMHAQKERHRARQRMSRTFKVDDMRLFCTAMRAVFQVVVDDIVEQGGEVTRIEGGKGGFFQEDGVTLPASVQRRSDASNAGV